MGSYTLGQTSVDSVLRRYAAGAFLVLVVIYAVLAGLRTITDADTGWRDAAAANSSFEAVEIKAQIESQIAEGRARVWTNPPAAP